MSALQLHPRQPRKMRRPGYVDLSAVSGLDEVEALMTSLAAPVTEGKADLAGDMVSEHLASGGKRLRARLTLATAAALGAAGGDAVAWAAAVELLHNATLIHDDIQDGDRTRRGRPTLWARYGTAQAINAGDLLLMLPFMAVAEASLDARAPLSANLASHAIATVRGQVDELDLLPSGKLDGGAYRRAICGKTGALFALATSGAAIIAGRSPQQAERIGDAFVPIGVLFQLQDDVLDLYGDKGRDLPGCDLYEGKVSALVVAHLARRPNDRIALLRLLRTPREQTSPEDVAAFIDAFRESGALADVIDTIEAIASRVAEHRGLAGDPALQALASELTKLALSPIAHLLHDASRWTEGAA